MSTLFFRWLSLGMLAVVLLNIGHWLAPERWLFDTFVHLRIQYLGLAAVVLILALGARRWGLLCLAIVSLAMNANPVLKHFDTPLARAMPNEQAGQSFRIAAANVFKRNNHFEKIAAMIRRQQTDLVVLVEATHELKKYLIQQGIPYPHVLMSSQAPTHGILMLSRFPLKSLPGSHSDRAPGLIADLMINDRPLRIIGIHAPWPIRLQGWRARNADQIRLAQFMRRQNQPILAVGDFNNSPFSASFQRMLEQGKLHNAFSGRGWMPTWPTFFPPAGIQIDHLLMNDQITVSRIKTGDGIGSDHRWMVADLLIR